MEERGINILGRLKRERGIKRKSKSKVTAEGRKRGPPIAWTFYFRTNFSFEVTWINGRREGRRKEFFYF